MRAFFLAEDITDNYNYMKIAVSFIHMVSLLLDISEIIIFTRGENWFSLQLMQTRLLLLHCTDAG